MEFLGYLVIGVGVLIMFFTMRYIFRELKGANWKEKTLLLLDHLTDVFWIQLNWTTLFMVLGVVILFIGIGLVLGFI
ncbi:hypothetical protein KUV80_16050 [Fictibacillus nanhaiensis]|uniref:hypothetical protein n=1 Tax=Fictibacillus nanhaiensis TaxID=742169 RepID=UPI001C947E2E|nr:hypothetical protein [Fictibacillus nanhaiensis]MBY6038173.1 hypothetical protein [Fictibacillus nanhaiensis]